MMSIKTILMTLMTIIIFPLQRLPNYPLLLISKILVLRTKMLGIWICFQAQVRFLFGRPAWSIIVINVAYDYRLCSQVGATLDTVDLCLCCCVLDGRSKLFSTFIGTVLVVLVEVGVSPLCPFEFGLSLFCFLALVMNKSCNIGHFLSFTIRWNASIVSNLDILISIKPETKD
jgi:hypothetical protein